MLDPWVKKRKDVLSDYLITIVFVVLGSNEAQHKARQAHCATTEALMGHLHAIIHF